MKFGQNPGDDSVPFRAALPRTRAWGHSASSFEIYFGCPVWTQSNWKGSFYPPKTPSALFLKEYAKQVPAIEFNGSFYNTPNLDQIVKWKDQVPSHFLFCPKVISYVSRARNLEGLRERMRNWCERIKHLAPNLGLSFLQLPENFSPKDLPILQEMLAGVPKDFAMAIEFRNADFFSDSEFIPEIRERFENNRFFTVISDTVGKASVRHCCLNKQQVMVRFLGQDLAPMDYQRIDIWAQRLKEWRDMGVGRVYFFLHEPDDTHAPTITQYFIDACNKAMPDLKLKNWVDYSQRQSSLF